MVFENPVCVKEMTNIRYAKDVPKLYNKDIFLKSNNSFSTQHSIQPQFPKRLNAMIDYFICLLIWHLHNLGHVIQSIDYYERIEQTFLQKYWLHSGKVWIDLSFAWYQGGINRKDGSPSKTAPNFEFIVMHADIL